jgi:hypothetical protein
MCHSTWHASAQEDIGAHPWRQPVVDRAEVQVDGLRAAKGALDKGETFVGTDDPIRRQGIALDAGADDIKTIEPGFGGDANGVAGKGRAVFIDGDAEQLGEVVAVSMRPTARAMLSCPLGQCAARSGRPAWSMLLRWPISSRLRARSSANSGFLQTTRRSPGNSGAVISARSRS